ncbi:hypothetical protein [Jannaschia sp. M317]|uniref:hypothetical protein n=1 Tax=Jannaschia sp. M317 TaxID=2867011 RepID=UPI0021A322E2|nr:hypothetical protein [Jannaschia sp. M317]UWQ18456.1 hypothetical protein K3551_03900 [Jannaschia sp. M317]
MAVKATLVLGTSAIVLLGACSTPLETCMRSASSSYSNALALKSTAQGNIARGYAIHRQRVPYQVASTCYNAYVGSYSCMQTSYRTQETPVPVNLAEERRRVRDIDRLLPKLRAEADAGVRQCQATYPAS